MLAYTRRVFTIGLPQDMKTDPVLPADLLKRLEHQAELDGLSLAEIVEKLVSAIKEDIFPSQRKAKENEDLGGTLSRDYPNLNRDALQRVQTGKSIFGSRHKLPPGFTPEYARLVLLRALGLFHELTHFPPERFHLSVDEKAILNSVIDRQGSRRA